MFKYNEKISFSETDGSSHGMLAALVSKNDVVLEFGCAKGELSAYLKEKLGCRTYAIEISETALEIAKEHLDGYVCCDIENYSWEGELSDIRFDTLIFADVLEHLKDPARAINRALSLLKDDGKILFSVPNIAHADIILKLLHNRFDYTEIGLLDNTHIHFFAKENLVDFCKDAGAFPALISGTVAPLGSTEQRLTKSSSSAACRVAREKEASDVYQFIVYAVKADFAKQNNIETLWRLDSSPKAKLYFDNTGSFSEETAIFVEARDGQLELGCDIPQGSRSIRIDLREENGYLLKAPVCLIDGREVEISSFQNASKIENDFYMLENDPQLFIKLPDDARRFEMRAELINMFSSEDASCIASALVDSYKSLSESTEDIKIQNEQIKKDLEVTSKNLELTTNHANNLENAIAINEKSIEDLRETNSTLATQNATLESEKSALEGDKASLEESKAQLEGENKALGERLNKAEKDYSILDTYSQEIKGELDHYKTHYFAAINQREDLKRQLADLQMRYDVISNAAWWKITKPFRVLFDILKYPFKHGPFLKVRKFFKVWREQGFKAAWRKAFRRKANAKKALTPLYTDKELALQRKFKFDRDIKFSVIVPLYNTPEKFLCEMIDSVVAQTYSNWELCLADGSDDNHKSVAQIVKKYAKHDSRILYKKLEKNLGISGNTNACLEMSTGDYITLFDHDDLLHPAALYNVMEAICEKNADFIYTDENTFQKTPSDAYCPHFKPDFSPDTLRSYNYICHLTTFSRELLDKVGMFRPEFDGSQDYDMILRLTEQAKCIVHIPKILYYWRCHKNSVASDISAKPYTIVSAKKALDEHLKRVGLAGKATDSRIPSTYKIEYEITGEPLVSIIIANKDYIEDLNKCITSVVEKSTYKNYEIIVVENNSTNPDTFKYYEEISKKYEQVKIVYWEGQGFNYSKINNYGFERAKGEYIILLNNDIEILTPSWIEEMLMFAQRRDVGAVGAMLYYPDDTIQHAGVIIGIGGDREFAVAGHSHKYFRRGDYGYCSRLSLAQNLSAVTAACVMIKSSVFAEVEGLDENYAVAFNDVDLCLKIRDAGYLIVWTPYAEAYHYESKSRGLETSPEKIARFNSEINRFLSKWRSVRDAGDPYYNPNLTLEHENFAIK